MKSIQKLVRQLDITELSPDAWRAAMKKLEWRFMLELQIPPSQIYEAIQSGQVSNDNKMAEQYIGLMMVKPYISGL